MKLLLSNHDQSAVTEVLAGLLERALSGSVIVDVHLVFWPQNRHTGEAKENHSIRLGEPQPWANDEPWDELTSSNVTIRSWSLARLRDIQIKFSDVSHRWECAIISREDSRRKAGDISSAIKRTKSRRIYAEEFIVPGNLFGALHRLFCGVH